MLPSQRADCVAHYLEHCIRESFLAEEAGNPDKGSISFETLADRMKARLGGLK